ncbi:MAG TPA: cobalamin-dependent protein [Thermodesulfovibrionales bacterium]|nr:cobalamin-dependent protein [Thermodesulfovibrionales bacterium]
MRVLLINPNRYQSPPVPPIGLEYVAASLEERGHTVSILDLCFSDSAPKALDEAVKILNPDITGLTVRNVDSALFHTNEFFLDGIRDIIAHIKAVHGLKTLIGGAGIMANPEGILSYLDADFAVAGPGEDTVHDILGSLERHDEKKIYYGRYREGRSFPGRSFLIDYREYVNNGGIAGFETHKGCSSSCPYCLEANSRVSFKNPADVVEEIRSFVGRGFSHFHLCDSEFNECLEYSTDFCSALKKESLGIKWAAYMKPTNFSKKLFQLMKETGVYLITLSVDSWKKCDLYWADIQKFIFGARSSGIKVAVDFLTGFPHETVADVRQCLDTLRRPMPDSIGVNTYIRLFKGMPITRMIVKDADLSSRLIGNTDDPTFVKPVFYNHIDTDMLLHIIDGDSTIRIEGPEKRVNYSRIDGP